jgi:hypothetical protein
MKSSRPASIVAIVFGLAAIAAIPVGVALAILLPTVNILPALEVSVLAAFVLGVIGISAARRARYKVDRSVYRVGEGSARFARFLVWSGVYCSLIGALALGVYGVLHASG